MASLLDAEQALQAVIEEQVMYPPTQAAGEVFTLDEIDQSILLCEAFLRHLIKEPENCMPAASQILSHIIWENRDRSEIILGMVKDGISSATYDKLDALFKLLGDLLSIEDSIAPERVASTIRELLIIFEDKKKLPKSTETNLAFLIHKLYDKNRYAKEYLDHLYRTTAGTPNDMLEWIEEWLLKHHYHGIQTPGWLLQSSEAIYSGYDGSD